MKTDCNAIHLRRMLHYWTECWLSVGAETGSDDHVSSGVVTSECQSEDYHWDGEWKWWLSLARRVEVNSGLSGDYRWGRRMGVMTITGNDAFRIPEWWLSLGAETGNDQGHWERWLGMMIIIGTPPPHLPSPIVAPFSPRIVADDIQTWAMKLGSFIFHQE